MSLFVDKIITKDDSAIQVDMAWHKQAGLLALGAYSEEQGGIVTIVDQSGFEVDAGKIPSHPTAQTSCLAWHPVQKFLVIGWESGELYIYSNGQCTKIDSLHNAPIHLGVWSSCGSSFISADKNGTIIGWRSDGNVLEMTFHHELKDRLSGLSFCHSPRQEEGINLTGLARAAVNGDEKALDLFSSWRSPPNTNQKNLNAYAGSANGIIYYLNENGSCMEVLQADGAVKTLLMWNDILIVITENMVIGQFQSEKDGSVSELSRVKLSTRLKENHVTWVASGQLAISSGEMNIRIWDLKNDDNYVLSYDPPDKSSTAEFITCLDFCSKKGILAAGSNAGKIVMFHTTAGSYPVGYREDHWRQLPAVVIGTSIRKLMWGGVNNVLALNTIRQVYFLFEQKRAVSFYKGVSAIQTSPNDLAINFYNSDTPSSLETKITIEKVIITDGHIVIYGAGYVLTYEFQKDIKHMMSVGEFQSMCDDIAAMDQSIYTLEGDTINCRSFQGTIKQRLSLTDVEGNGNVLKTWGKFLVCGTINNYVKIWDISKREARLHIHPINLQEKIQDFTSINDMNLNSTGTYLSVSNTNSADSRLYVLDFESNTTCYFNFRSGRSEKDDISVPPNSATSNSGSTTGADDYTKEQLSRREIVCHAWDQSESNFLVCQTVPSTDAEDVSESSVNSFVSLFFHEEHGLIVHDAFSNDIHYSTLVGVDVPFIYLCQQEQEGGNTVKQVLLKDFEGLNTSDAKTKEAVVKFSFYLSIGNMDEAFRAIKMIQNKKIWGNLARMCVKSQRIDVATICLGKMEHSCGARAMRHVLQAKVPKDVQVAVLSIYLGMHEEAERILIKSGQHELLNKFYQDSGRWQKALNVAEKQDRMHLRSTCYNYAKHLESKYDMSGAITFYEKSGTSNFEVPRLLFEDWNALESYVDKSNDKAMKRWLAQYLESTGEMEVALQYYELAEDYLSLVRVYCYCENLEKAAEIANSSGDKAACYHLARQYENMDDIPSAIHFFSKAQAYSNAIRICKEQRYDDHIWNLALLASSTEKFEAAKYFEKNDKPSFDKAVVLYEKAGYFGKALDLAIRTNQYNALQSITRQLSHDADPILLAKAANFFLENQQYEKAVDLFVASHQTQKALDLCLQYNITIDENMAEKLTGGTGDQKPDADSLNKLAEVCYRQGNYHLATKKWTQAGNRLQAMKALLKSGDTEKIIFFANVSRDKDIYILAGNYLQTLDWRNNADIMRNIIAFYQKGKAYDLLGWFYQSCGEVEIDEYQNYEKALGALSECLKCLQKADGGMQVNNRTGLIMRQIDLIQKFVDYQRIYESDPETAIEGAKSLLREEDINSVVRKGDIYGFLIEHYTKAQNYRLAHQLIDELRSGIPNVNLAYYVNSDILLTIEKALGVALMPDHQQQHHHEYD